MFQQTQTDPVPPEGCGNIGAQSEIHRECSDARRHLLISNFHKAWCDFSPHLQNIHSVCWELEQMSSPLGKSQPAYVVAVGHRPGSASSRKHMGMSIRGPQISMKLQEGPATSLRKLCRRFSGMVKRLRIVRAYIHAHTYTQAHIHTGIHANLHIYVHTETHTGTHTLKLDTANLILLPVLGTDLISSASSLFVGE